MFETGRRSKCSYMFDGGRDSMRVRAYMSNKHGLGGLWARLSFGRCVDEGFMLSDFLDLAELGELGRTI